MAVCQPHYMEIIATSFAFVACIAAGGLLLGFLTTNQDYRFGTVPAGDLNIHKNDVEQVGVFDVGGSPTCSALTYPVAADVDQVKLNNSRGAGQGFLAAGIVAIIAGFLALVHLSHLVRLKWMALAE